MLFNTKRLKYGTSLFNNKKFTYTFTIITIAILVTKTFDYSYTNSKMFTLGISKGLVISMATFLLAILLFTWWRKQISKSYIDKLRKLEVQSLYDELEEKKHIIQKLTEDNQSLARIVHKDNKLIPAMENAVTDYLCDKNFTDLEQLRQYGQTLAKDLHQMALERKGILDSYEIEGHKLKLTGHVQIDAILVFMQKKAESNNITLECKHSPEYIDYMLTKIHEDDLVHLLSDLIENAIISIAGKENGRLVVTFGKLQKEAYVSVADNGKPFDIAVLHSFGLQPHTTHKEEGGSGFGLMDIWKIKKKYRATIQIQEYAPEMSDFSKRIIISFNSKNHYVIQSYRHNEIKNTQTRNDLYILSMDTKEKNEGKQNE